MDIPDPDFSIPYPRSRGQKGNGSRIRIFSIPDPEIKNTGSRIRNTGLYLRKVLLTCLGAEM
jgi:hypothetical protein